MVRLICLVFFNSWRDWFDDVKTLPGQVARLYFLAATKERFCWQFLLLGVCYEKSAVAAHLAELVTLK